MAAGFGTRLEPLTLAVPKPMVPIINKPMMHHNLELLRKHGINQVIANIHYHPEQIQNYFSDGSDFGVDLSYSYEEKLMGTAGGVWRMGRVVEKIEETFIVLSSDALTDINLRKLVEFHKSKKALVTIALCPKPNVEDFGIVEIDGDDRIINFKEKPKAHEVTSNLVNSGIYVFEPEILDLIPADKFYDFGKELFPKLVKEGAAIYGYKMVEYWSDVGCLNAYLSTNLDAMNGSVRLVMPGKKASSHVWVGKNCVISPSARFEGNVMIGDRCEIKSGVVIKDSVIGNTTVIGTETRIADSLIWSDSIVAGDTSISSSIIGNWCRVEESVIIEENCVISNRVQVRAGTHIKPGTLIKPREIL